MSGGSYNYLYCKEPYELFTYHNVKTLEEMESRFLELGHEDVAKDFRRLIEYIKSANNRVEVLGRQLNGMMHDIEWCDSGDIGRDALAESVERYRLCRVDTPQTESTGSPIGDYRDGAGAWAPMPLGDPGSISDETLLTALTTWLDRNPGKVIRIEKHITKFGPRHTADIEEFLATGESKED